MKISVPYTKSKDQKSEKQGFEDPHTATLRMMNHDIFILITKKKTQDLWVIDIFIVMNHG